MGSTIPKRQEVPYLPMLSNRRIGTTSAAAVTDASSSAAAAATPTTCPVACGGIAGACEAVLDTPETQQHISNTFATH